MFLRWWLLAEAAAVEDVDIEVKPLESLTDPLQVHENTHQGFLLDMKHIIWKVGLQFRYLENGAEKSYDSSQSTLWSRHKVL